MKIIDRLPISREDTLLFLGAESVRVKKDQIIVWVSLTIESAVQWNPATPRFPAILDTGHSHNFAIQRGHLARWAGIQRDSLRLLGHIRHGGKRMPLHALRLWLHRNQTGETTASVDEPLFLNLLDGVAAYPDGEDYPRLPLLGLRAIVSNHLHLTLDGEHASVTMRTPDWRTQVLSWLG